jgi:hypothetical protein
MKMKWLLRLSLGIWIVAATALARAPAPLAFRIDEGHNINSFLRDGPVAAHLLLRAGNEPRILVAFPAGNSGVGLWFARTSRPVSWTLVSGPRPLTTHDGKGRDLHGIEFEVETDAPELRSRGAVLSSIRVLRDYELQARAPAEVSVAPQVVGARVSWTRDRLDGAAGYQLIVEALGTATANAQEFSAAPGKPLHLKIRALTGEQPLTPLDAPLTAAAGNDTRSREVLAFLAYREKYLAGSWRFDTYFGRDTLISALLLAPVLEPEALESAIASVLERLAPNGEVAHEEDIGEFAVLRNAREGRGRIATPVYDYGMVDDDFLLAPLAARWLSDHESRTRAQRFLGGRLANGESRGHALVRNLAWVVERSANFAADPRATNLVGIKPGRMTGNWRDSEQGLGRGRFAYDINTALVPAALEAAARLVDDGLLGEYLETASKRTLARAREFARTWTARAPQLFAVEVSAPRARDEITAYSRDLGVDPARALRALDDHPLRFDALSLDAEGRPVPVLNSDEGFRLLLILPGEAELERCVTAIMRPFPAGLLTDAGLLVANPAPAGPELEREFTRYAYHGTVIWSWQQALLAAGFDRQLQRTDLGDAMRAKLTRARADLWTVIGQARALRTSELWSWSYANGRYRAEPFGRPGADVDESNAAQLWSTVYLGLRPPTSGTGTSPGN